MKLKENSRTAVRALWAAMLPFFTVPMVAHAQTADDTQAATVMESNSATSSFATALASDKMPVEWYLGANVGWANAAQACESQATACDKNDMAYGVFVGATLNRWLAVQVGYDYLGKINADYPALGHPTVNAPYQAKTQGVELALRPYWQVNDSTTLYAKAGTLRWGMDVTGEEFNYTYEADDSGWAPLLGVGAEWAFSPRWRVFGEFQQLFGVGSDSVGGTDISMLNVGLRYHFTSASVEPAPVSAPAAKPVLPLAAKPATDAVAVVPPFTASDPIPSRAPDWSLSGAFGGTALTASAQDQLAIALAQLKAHPQIQLMIVGHTDSIGRAQDNQALSEARANTVQAYFLEHGIASSRMNARGMGESMPVADNRTAKGREKNRRVDLFVRDVEFLSHASSLN
ncbi:TPA: OmpA family protein [Aeromonas dhakensis]|nr:OmpA family protein [Aeromonas dhakensis]